MARHELGEVIATRTLMVESDRPSSREVTISLGKPHADGRDFYCAYEIKGAGRDKVMRVYGVDGFQALVLALTGLRADIEALNNELGGRLRWDAGAANDFGFPPSEQA